MTLFHRKILNMPYAPYRCPFWTTINQESNIATLFSFAGRNRVTHHINSWPAWWNLCHSPYPIPGPRGEICATPLTQPALIPKPCVGSCALLRRPPSPSPPDTAGQHEGGKHNLVHMWKVVGETIISTTPFMDPNHISVNHMIASFKNSKTTWEYLQQN